jgi:hypothetical protein
MTNVTSASAESGDPLLEPAADKSASAGPSASAKAKDKEAARVPAPDDKATSKEKFREALDRKNSAAHVSAEGSRNTGSVHGSESTGPGKRMFRRKSGG